MSKQKRKNTRFWSPHLIDRICAVWFNIERFCVLQNYRFTCLSPAAHDHPGIIYVELHCITGVSVYKELPPHCRVEKELLRQRGDTDILLNPRLY